MKPKKHLPRKLLVAALGVATINYVALACGGGTTDNPPTSGNLPFPAPPADQYVPPPTSGNLPAPPPMDGSLDAHDAADADGGEDASDASDGGV